MDPPSTSMPAPTVPGESVWTDVQAPLRQTTFTAWTIEASFKLDPAVTGGNQAILSKDGNPFGGQPPFHLKYLAASGMLEIGLIDGSGTVKYLVGETIIESGKWYSVAATATADTLSLWIKAEGSSAYVLDGIMTIDGAFYNSYAAFNDAWAVGRARWNGGETDWFKGWIDEVRISGAALTSDKFLASGTASPFETWAAANIPDVSQRGESADPDGDGTSNLTEFRLGLNPVSGASFFGGTLSGSTITWPGSLRTRVHGPAQHHAWRLGRCGDSHRHRRQRLVDRPCSTGGQGVLSGGPAGLTDKRRLTWLAGIRATGCPLRFMVLSKKSPATEVSQPSPARKLAASPVVTRDHVNRGGFVPIRQW